LTLLDKTDRQGESIALLEELIADQRLDAQVRDDLQVQMIYSLVKARNEDVALRRLDVLAAENNDRRHRLLLTKGELLDRLNRHDEALAAYDLALKASGDYDFQYEVLMAKSDSLASLGKVDEAVALLDKIVADKETPRYLLGETLLQKSMILRDAGRKADAEAAEEKAIESAESPEEKAELRKLIDQLRRLSM
jgi:tetratricopeptide (TPR) repeat protein